MENNYYAMIETATEKYTQLADYICKLQNGIEVNPELLSKLIRGIYKDEIYLINQLKDIGDELHKQQKEPDLKIFGFMTR